MQTYKVIEKASGNIFVIKQGVKLGKGDKLLADNLDAIQARKKQESILFNREVNRRIERMYK